MTKRTLLFFYSFMTVFILLLAASCGQRHGSGSTDDADSSHPYFGHLLDVSAYGAKGDGHTDDTKAIQGVINQAAAGDTVLIPEGTYLVKTLRMRAYVHLKGIGLLKQPATLTAETYSKEQQNSLAPLIRIHLISDVSLSFRAETMNEAVYVSKSSNIRIRNSQLRGDSSKLRSFPGILMYDCDDCQVSQSEISEYGKTRQSARTYQPGTGIRLMDCDRVQVFNNHIHHNGENGLFIHSSANITIDQNDIHHNGMSAVQIAFGNSAREKNYRITNNRLMYNAADAVDINNRSPRAAAPIHCLIAGNISLSNGFVRQQPTVDGSGIATLINVSEVTLRNNKAYKNNRPSVYLENCGSVNIEANQSDGTVEVNQKFDSIALLQNQFGRLLLLANAKGKRLLLQENRIKRLSFPNGIQADSLILEHNEILSGPININMTGHVRLYDNDIHSQDNAGALLLVKASSALIRKNRITNAQFYAIVTRKGSGNILLDSNRIASVNAGVNDDGSAGLRVTNNVFISQQGGHSQLTLMSNNPQQLVLARNEHRNLKAGKSIVLSGEGSARVTGEHILYGKPDFGKVRIDSLDL